MLCGASAWPAKAMSFSRTIPSPRRPAFARPWPPGVASPSRTWRTWPFLQPEIARLRELRLRALEDRFDADLALGRGREIVPELETLVAEEPLREHPRAQLMRALYGAGRQADALRVYQEGRRQLAEELGIDPSRSS